MVAPIRNLLLYISWFLSVPFFCIQASNVTLTEEPGANRSLTENKEHEFLHKHEIFKNCPKFYLDPDEYVVYSNATVYVIDYNRSYTEEFYSLEGDTLLVCVPTSAEFKKKDLTYTLEDHLLLTITTVAIWISMACLLIHVVVFILVPEKPNIPDYNMASLCASLFLSYLLMTVDLSNEVHQNKVACIVLAGTKQFVLMSTFLWMFVIAFDVFKSIRQATSNLIIAPIAFKIKTFLCNILVAWGVSLLFTAAAMIVDNIDGVSTTFQPYFSVSCWFNTKESVLVFFLVPAATVLCVNFILFGISSYKIFNNQLQSNAESHQSRMRRNHVMYIRLAIIMGVTWIIAAVAPGVNAFWLWYLFAALNAFQGFFIFAGFTCTGKARKYFKQKFCGRCFK